MLRLTDAAITVAREGTKAHFLGVLAHLGIRVPDGVVLSVDERFDAGLLPSSLADGPVAVRSSSPEEDGTQASQAGAFLTVLGASGAENIRKAVEAVRASGGSAPMGVIIQRYIPAGWGGVAFSADPLSFDLGVSVIEWVRGSGDALVSGRAVGTALRVDSATGARLQGDWEAPEALRDELAAVVRRLTAELGFPVDVEWCIDTGGRALWILQVRPIVLPSAITIDLGSADGFERMPSFARSHPKLRLRAAAAAAGVPMTPSVVRVATAIEQPWDLTPGRTREPAGSSVVLLHPFTVERKVVRRFAAVLNEDVELFEQSCRRYSVRQYPDFDGVDTTHTEVLATGLERSAVAISLEQDIWDAWLTGIVRRLGDGYVLEVAIGHFVPKGFVQTSTYFLDAAFAVTERRETTQSVAYHFVNGHVVREEQLLEQPRLHDAEAASILSVLAPLLDHDRELALEFGVMVDGDRLEPYVIDAAESDERASALDADALARGVVSSGVAQGRVVDLRGRGNGEPFDDHLLSALVENPPHEHAIYVADRASIDLLPLVKALGPGSGFVFREASLLAHLAVVMRERGIPAVIRPRELEELVRAGAARIDTSAAGGTVVATGGQSA